MANCKTALITGITGQDGAYLAEFLLSKGYIVYGSLRRSSQNNLWRLDELGITKEVKLVNMELTEFSNIARCIEQINPDEIYNLAAQSFVGVSFEQPIFTGDVDGLGVARLLEAIRLVNPKIKFYQASTSEMFGKVQAIPQCEDTPFYPRSPYGVAKLYGHWTTINYRESYNLFACSGILFNHESPLRGEEFVTRKITLGLAKVINGLQDRILLGNLDSKRDWGYAKDYMSGMWKMLQQDTPDDYILATGETHSIKDFIDIAVKILGIDFVWEGEGKEVLGKDKKTNKVLVQIDPTLYRPSEVDLLIGDASKAKEKLGWEPQVSFENLVSIMVEADLKKIKRNNLVLN